ncbi:MAG: ABC transporter permease [bacterium]|nr:ABC transporter permease [bacterium]MCM1374573.1 ABC transporter permease [Muribaculum sp.]
MLSKLALRNMKRSARDYLVYILTMTVVTALMYAASSLFFQNDLAQYFSLQDADMMAVMIGVATFFIVLIVAWLINYMVRFMLEKRSTEFGIYLLLGMKKRDISRLYIRENVLLGCIAFLLGCALGVLVRQLLFSILFSMVRMEYHLRFSFSQSTLLMTVLCYGGCYLLALIRCRHKLRRMNIQALMNAKRQNEEIREKHEGAKRLLLPLAILFILLFWAIFNRLSNAVEILMFLTGLVLTIYLFYTGLSAWLICYVRKKGSAVYRGQSLFLLRQFASKIRTMQFTMGTLTSLFTLALMGASIALMFSTYENTVLEDKFPFDIQIYSGDVQEDFAEAKELLTSRGIDAQYYTYHIYTDREIRANSWVLTHLPEWGTIYQNADGSPNQTKIKEMLSQEYIYYSYDTYMGISDYNRLRAMLGYEEIALDDGEYLFQIKPRLYQGVLRAGMELQFPDASGQGTLTCAGIVGDPFSQDGHNGADYLIVVPDAVLGRMEPYYSELVAAVQSPVPLGLQDDLDEVYDRENRLETLYSYLDGGGKADNELCTGSDNIISYVGLCLVRANIIPEMQYILSSLIIPLFYIGLVFVCVAMTVLSVQQLSDSAKYKFRYDVLAKLGLDRSSIRRLIGKQLAAYYLCPAFLAILISGRMVLFVSNAFVKMTGVPTSVSGFFLQSIALFFGIYLVYFIVTYVGFTRNVEEHNRG